MIPRLLCLIAFVCFPSLLFALNDRLVNTPLFATVVIIRPVAHFNDSSQLYVRSETLAGQPHTAIWQLYLDNKWLDHYSLRVGERWRLRLRLKPPHAHCNPGSHCVLRRYTLSRVEAVGNILPSAQNKKLGQSSRWFVLQRFRQRIADFVTHHAKQHALQHLILALTIGMRVFDRSEWQVFQRTGTSHLVAISGLHVGLIALCCYGLFRFLWPLSPMLARYLPAQKAGWLFSMWGAFCYVALAGSAIPARRALVLLLLVCLSKLYEVRVSLPWLWLFSVVLLLCIDVQMLFSVSFYLSVYAVAVIAYVLASESSGMSRIRCWWRSHVIIYVAMLPASITFFSMLSLSAFFVNLLAIPWISFLIAPLLLLMCVTLLLLPSVSPAIFWLVSVLLAPFWSALVWVSQHAAGLWFLHVDYLWGLLGVSLIGLLFFPVAWRWRLSALLMVIVLLFERGEPLKQGDFRLTVLDVGQGLSVLVRTARHALLYDTGFSWRHYSAAQSIILPALHARHVRRLDRLLVSHLDRDHAGGVSAILAALPVADLLSSDPRPFTHAVQAWHCHRGQHWRWDQVDFYILWPLRGQPYQGNNSSCVLLIRAHGKQFLLAGDIERPVEQRLLALAPIFATIDLLIAPHHGSSSSSTWSWLESILPKNVIFSTGYYNRYHFPHTKVEKRYRDIGANRYNTAVHGAVTASVINGRMQIK